MDPVLAAIPYPEIDPYLIHFGGAFGIRWYALAYIAGILIGWRYIARLTRNTTIWAGDAPVTARHIDDFVAWATFGIILGGRLGYVLFYKPNLLWTEPLETIAIWNGGMSFHGGLIGVGLVTYLFARQNKIPTLRLMDALACAAPIGLFFGRIANFINGELWGRPWDGPWAMVFPDDPAQVARHPSQLYEAALEGVVLFAALRIASHHLKWLAKPGALTGAFLAGYGLSRTFVEFFREPDIHMPDFPIGLTMGMMLSIPMVVAGGLLIARALKDGPDAPGDAPRKPADATRATATAEDAEPSVAQTDDDKRDVPGADAIQER